MPRRTQHLLLACAALVACNDADPSRDDIVCGREEQRVIPLWQKPALDILVVLDRSPSMADEQTKLATFGADMKLVLEQIEGGLPDMHIAIVTSDLGASGVGGCGAGDGAAFQNGPRCGLTSSFLEARGLVAGGVAGNFPGTLEDALACLLDVPMSTCPVSQPLGAAVRALDGSVTANVGFRRDYAALLVVVVTDGDDCTLTASNALADVAAQGDLEGAIDFACFARGTVCTPSDPATPGAHTECRSRANAGVADVDALITQLRALQDPRNLFVSTVAASGDPVVLGSGRLDDACSGNPVASAAPRLATIALSDRTFRTNVCGDWIDSLIVFAELTRTSLGVACLDASVDLDPATPGFQVNCVNRLADRDGNTIAPLPWCDATGVDRSGPCIESLVPDVQTCSGTALGAPGAAVHVSLGDERLPEELYAELRCEVLCE